jgi:hypothetical protein
MSRRKVERERGHEKTIKGKNMRGRKGEGA